MSKKTSIKPEQAKVLKELEKLIGKSIPQVYAIDWNIPGVKLEDNNIVGLVFLYNGLTSLPDSFGQLKSLKWLYLEGNQLTALPETFGQLKSL